MGDARWTEGEILEIGGDQEEVLDRLVKELLKKVGVVFAAKLGFGVPCIDIVTVDEFWSTTGYVLKLPVVEGVINTLPYFQGFGEASFLTDQMLDGAYIIVPDIELADRTPFTRSPDPIYRLKNAMFEAGICTFGRDFRVNVFQEPKGSMAKQFERLKIELMDSILNFGEIVVGEGMEEKYREWVSLVKSEIARLGEKRLLDEESASVIVKKILEERNYRDIKMTIKEDLMKAKPKPIPIFVIEGTGYYLGDDKAFSLSLSRISGVAIKRDY